MLTGLKTKNQKLDGGSVARATRMEKSIVFSGRIFIIELYYIGVFFRTGHSENKENIMM
jgi:hypothetical protein